MVPTEQLLAENSVDQLRMMLVERGGSYAKGENKTALVNRILELGVAVQVNEKINHASQNQTAQAKPVAIVQPRMTKEEAREAIKRWLPWGITMKFSPDGNLWMMQYEKGKISRTDSGNMAIPPAVLTRCAEMLVRPKAGERLDIPPEKQAVAEYVED